MHGPDRLKAWIARSRLTQREAARLFGLHYTFLNQILSGRRVPGLANAVTIERETGISVEVWMPTEGGKSEDVPESSGRKRKSA